MWQHSKKTTVHSLLPELCIIWSSNAWLCSGESCCWESEWVLLCSCCASSGRLMLSRVWFHQPQLTPSRLTSIIWPWLNVYYSWRNLCWWNQIGSRSSAVADCINTVYFHCTLDCWLPGCFICIQDGQVDYVLILCGLTASFSAFKFPLIFCE